MCGIIGYLGGREATPILMESLKRLEYRGYDSAGVAVLEAPKPGSAGRTSVTKSEAKVDTLIEKLEANMPSGHLGIGHTRWATHGKPTYINAHPHTDCDGKIFVVHNGIIENFAELKAELQAEGHEFPSETDTEVVPHLIEKYYKGDFLAAVRAALRRIKGAYALAMFSSDDPELLVGARLNAPLVVGLGADEYYIASDITAIIPYTKRVLVLGDGGEGPRAGRRSLGGRSGPGRGRVGVPLAPPAAGRPHARCRDQPVRRDGGHACRDAAGEGPRRAQRGGDQRDRKLGRSRCGRRDLSPRRTRNRSRVDQDDARPRRQPVPARSAPGDRQRTSFARAQAGAGRGASPPA